MLLGVTDHGTSLETLFSSAEVLLTSEDLPHSEEEQEVNTCLEIRRLRDQSFHGSFLWHTLCAKGNVRKRQSLGARWSEARRGLDSLGMLGGFWKKGEPALEEGTWTKLEPSDWYLGLQEADYRTEENQQMLKSFWFRRLYPESQIAGRCGEALVCALPQAIHGLLSQREVDQMDLSSTSYSSSMCLILNFAIASGSSQGHCLKGISLFSEQHQFKMSAPLLRTLLSALASLSS